MFPSIWPGALYQAGFKSLLMDCDLGLANLDVLLGITPEGTLQNALLGEAQLSRGALSCGA